MAKILVVDDDKEIVEAIKIYLSGKGQTRADGEAIIEKMVEAAPSLLEL